jgi:hypothetical protein
MNMKPITPSVTALLLVLSTFALAAENEFAGDWALTIPGGHAGWLRISDNAGKLTGQILWGWGSVIPVDEVKVEGDQLVLTRLHRSQRRDAEGKTIREVTTETITATLDGQKLNLVTSKKLPDGKQTGEETFSGKRMPPAPDKPDLAKVKFGTPVQLFNGKDLSGWKLLEPNAVNGWSVKDGVLSNNPVQEQGKPHRSYGNLRTEKEFEDFNLTMDVSVPNRGNSGVYLRGIYEVQVADTYGRNTDSHNMGGVYSRVKPSESAEKPAGEWQTLDITLVDRHVTVVLNGKKIIDNQFVAGPTGGALWSDPNRPGPIYLQGDHSGVSYRNIALKPVVK